MTYHKVRKIAVFFALCGVLHANTLQIRTVIRDPHGANSYARMDTTSTSNLQKNGNVGSMADVFVLQENDSTFTMTRSDITLRLLELKIQGETTEAENLKNILTEEETARNYAIVNGTATNVTVNPNEIYKFSHDDFYAEIVACDNEILDIDIYEDLLHPEWGAIFVNNSERVEQPKILVEEPQDIDFQADNTANFTLHLSNESSTSTDLKYKLSYNEFTVPDYLEVKVDGEKFTSEGVEIHIPAGAAVDKNLQFRTLKNCKISTKNVKFYLTSLTDDLIFSSDTLSVNFTEASEMKMQVEKQGKRIVDLTEISSENWQLEDVELLYRKSNETVWKTYKNWGSGDVSEHLEWMLKSGTFLTDGTYVLQAKAHYTYEGIDFYRSSNECEILIDRTAPKMTEKPLPTNGIYTEKDEISVQFDQEIQAVAKDDVQVIVNNEEIDFQLVTDSNKIIVLPKITPAMEGLTMTVTVRNVCDIEGNKTDDISWQMKVNFCHLQWQNPQISVTDVSGCALKIHTLLENVGDGDDKWQILDLPEDLETSQMTGEIGANDSLAIDFNVNPLLVAGQYDWTVKLINDKGCSVPLFIHLNLTADMPEWKVETSDNPLTINALCSILCIPCENPEDRLSAFDSNGTCIGMAKAGYDEELQCFVHRLTIYGTPSVFKYWEASSGRIYTPLITDFDMENVAQTVHFTAMESVEQKIALHEGENWISFNVGDEEGVMTRLAQMAKSVISVENTDGRAVFVNGIASGNLKTLRAGKFYKIFLKDSAELVVRGIPADTGSVISLSSGINELAFLPQQSMPVAMALRSIHPLEGDVVQSLSETATYTDGKWQGTLTVMHPGQGYIYNRQTPLVEAQINGGTTSIEDVRQSKEKSRIYNLDGQKTSVLKGIFINDGKKIIYKF